MEYIINLDVDELNNMSIEELIELEDKVWKYYRKVKTVREFSELC